MELNHKKENFADFMAIWYNFGGFLIIFKKILSTAGVGMLLNVSAWQGGDSDFTLK